MRAGRLFHVVDLQRRSSAKGESGAAKASAWTTYSTRRASIDPLSGRELLLARQIEARTTHEVRTRCDVTAPVMAMDRVAFRDGTRVRYFGVLSVTDVDERNRELVLSCVEDVTATGI